MTISEDNNCDENNIIVGNSVNCESVSPSDFITSSVVNESFIENPSLLQSNSRPQRKRKAPRRFDDENTPPRNKSLR